jgi:hypothetical protein
MATKKADRAVLDAEIHGIFVVERAKLTAEAQEKSWVHAPVADGYVSLTIQGVAYRLSDPSVSESRIRSSVGRLVARGAVTEIASRGWRCRSGAEFSDAADAKAVDEVQAAEKNEALVEKWGDISAARKEAERVVGIIRDAAAAKAAEGEDLAGVDQAICDLYRVAYSLGIDLDES